MVRLEERVGVQSARQRGQKYQLTLIHACKPHTQPVTSLAIDPEGKILASGSTDKTVFFLSIEDQYKPMGFIRVPAAVTTMKWSPNKKVLLKITVSYKLVLYTSYKQYVATSSTIFVSNCI